MKREETRGVLMDAVLDDKERARILTLRRNILTTLYHFFVAHPYAAMELGQLAETCEVAADDLNWNIVYLEKSGYVELTRSSDCLPYIACAGAISATGVDLVENSGALDARFPLAE